jgi:hypothetical protein
MSETSDKTCLSYWFPVLVRAGIPVPPTVVIDAGEEWRKMIGFMDGQDADPLPELCEKVRNAAVSAEIGGYPIFLRTGHGSGKHGWSRTCYVNDPRHIAQHIGAIIEWSEMVDIMGLPYRIWAVRKFLHLDYRFKAFEGMPIANEWRAFISGGSIVCVHPYWPIETLEGHVAGAFRVDRESLGMVETDTSWREAHSDMFNREPPEGAVSLARSVAAAFNGDGSWSVDVCRTVEGEWLVTDMAEAHKSYHFPGCPAENTAPWNNA